MYCKAGAKTFLRVIDNSTYIEIRVIEVPLYTYTYIDIRLMIFNFFT